MSKVSQRFVSLYGEEAESSSQNRKMNKKTENGEGLTQYPQMNRITLGRSFSIDRQASEMAGSTLCYLLQHQTPGAHNNTRAGIVFHFVPLQNSLKSSLKL